MTRFRQSQSTDNTIASDPNRLRDHTGGDERPVDRTLCTQPELVLHHGAGAQTTVRSRTAGDLFRPRKSLAACTVFAALVVGSVTACADDAATPSLAPDREHPLEATDSFSVPREVWVDDFELGAWSADAFEATDLRFLPDGRALLTTKGGWANAGVAKLVLISADGKSSRDILNLSVCADAERGLLGLEIDPDFSSNGLIYVFYTRQMSNCHLSSPEELQDPPRPVYNRLSSYVFDEAGIDPASEKVLLDELPGHQSSHNGGGLGFLPDGTILVATGEAKYERSRDIDFAGGKLLRIDPAVPQKGALDNPFYDPADPRSIRSLVYAAGFRNPFRFGVDLETGVVAVADVGTDTYEEINIVRPGGDYGFPDGEGPENVEDALPPALWYDHADGCTSVIGGSWLPPGWVSGIRSPAFAFADFGCGQVSIAYFDGAAATRVLLAADDVPYAVSNMVLGPDNALYLVGIGPGPSPVQRLARTKAPD